MPTAGVTSSPMPTARRPAVQEWLARLPEGSRLRKIVLLASRVEEVGFDGIDRLELAIADIIDLGYPPHEWREAVVDDVGLLSRMGLPITADLTSGNWTLVVQIDMARFQDEAIDAFETNFDEILGIINTQGVATKENEPPLLRETFETGRRAALNAAVQLISGPELEFACRERLETLDLEKLGDAAVVLGSVAVLSQLRQDIRTEMEHLVRQAREWGATWQDVGAVEGVVAQTAFQRWSEQGQRQHRDAQHRRKSKPSSDET